MFSLTVTDHLRLDAEHSGRNYAIHAREAERLVAFALAGRLVTASLLAIATAAEISNLLFPGRVAQIVAIAASAVALIIFTLYSVTGLESRVSAHRAFAHRLWMLSEQFRSLISEIDDGLVDRESQLRRRDELLAELHEIYGQGFGVDQRGYERARLPQIPTEHAA